MSRPLLLLHIAFLSLAVALEPSHAEVAVQQDGQQQPGQVISDAESHTTPTVKQHPLDCGIWLAPSTIKGAGLGMYAGRNYSSDEYLQAVGDLVVPIIDTAEHAGAYSDDPWTFLWYEYTWRGDSLHVDHEGLYIVDVTSPGFGSAANSFLALHNIDAWTATYDAAGLHRATDPGAGAFTPYYDRKILTRRDIQQGEEFFANYGEQWFKTRPKLGPVPLFTEIDSATELVREFQKLKVPPDIADELWDIFIRNSQFKATSRVIGAFQHDNYKEELQELQHHSLKELRIKQSTRSLEWLAEYGTCGDHLYAGPSTIPQAGRGAFASRLLPAGTFVASLPLIHVTDRNRLTMYNLDDVDGELKPRKEHGILGYQLLVNYCLGHAESTLLLCPYGPMTSYINHNATYANVQLRWSDPSRGNHMPALLNDTIEALEADATAKLAFELVAKRDIMPGEEVFLDYGIAWEQAWLKHVARWEPADDDYDYVPAWKVNQDTPYLWTVFHELEEPRYPENVELRCHKAFVVADRVEWEFHVDNNTIEDYLVRQGDVLLPCEVLRYRIKDRTIRYTVVMWAQDEKDETQDVHHFVEDIPRIGLKFVDEPYTSDLFLPTAFRHDIRIPDELFPEMWKNLKQATKQ